MTHTILLVQPTPNPSTRTYADFENVNEAMEGICKMFEAHLKATYPDRQHMDYSIQDLRVHVDTLADITALVFNPSTGSYSAYTKEWIKERVFKMLKSSAAK